MIVSSEAQEELLAAVGWYEESFPADRFDARARRAALPRFPYAAVFVVTDDDVRVVAMAHDKRRPGYWRGRV